MARPFYEGLRHAYPKADITLLCRKQVADLWYPDLMNERQVMKAEDERGTRLLGLAGEIRRKQFELAVSLPTSYRGTLLFFLAGIAARVGFSEGGSGIFLTSSLAWQGRRARKHKTRLYLELLEALTANESALTLPKLESRIRENLIILAPGASISLREWPYFEGLIAELQKTYPETRLVVVGSQREMGWKERIEKKALAGVESWVGETSLTELTDRCCRARLVIANDSGVAHLAGSLAGAPTLVIFGPGDPRYVLPLGPRVHFVRDENLACSPCESAVCQAPYGYQECLKRLSLERVMKEVRDILVS